MTLLHYLGFFCFIGCLNLKSALTDNRGSIEQLLFGVC